MSKISKLGLGIVAFDNFEFLPSIIYEVKPYCDHIVLCVQNESYHGEPLLDSERDAANLLLERGYVDNIIWFEKTNDYKEITNGDAPRFIECDKRNFILDYLENQGCSHSIIIDSDEYYNGVDFKRAKDIIDKGEDIHVTYVQYINYYRDYRHLLVWPYDTYVPFISESSYRFDYKKGNIDKPCDPTRRYFVGDGTYTIISYEAVKMHHLSWIRLDIERKIDSWSARERFKQFDVLKRLVLNRYYNYKDGMNAVILFMTPESNVAVTKLPKQYIHPKFKFYEDYKPYEDCRDDNVNTD